MIWDKNPRLTSNSDMSTKLSAGSHSDIKSPRSTNSADDSANDWKARYEQAAAEVKQLRAQLAERSAVKSVQPEPPTPVTTESRPLQDKSESSEKSSEQSETSSSSSSSSSSEVASDSS